MSTTSDFDLPAARRQLWLTKIAIFLAVSVAIGWFYGWASGRFFPEKTRVGFAHGVIHGALMPMALPSLVMGKDVQIYDENNSGRSYKLGYICGINLCGIAFFGPLFWRPAKTKTPDKRRDAKGAEVRGEKLPVI